MPKLLHTTVYPFTCVETKIVFVFSVNRPVYPFRCVEAKIVFVYSVNKPWRVFLDISDHCLTAETSGQTNTYGTFFLSFGNHNNMF